MTEKSALSLSIQETQLPLRSLNFKTRDFEVSRPKRLNDIPRPQLIQNCLEETSRFFEVSPLILQSKTRKQPISEMRQITMFLLREGSLGLKEIGEILGDRDHSTVFYGVQKIQRLIPLDERVRRSVELIRNQIINPESVD